MCAPGACAPERWSGPTDRPRLRVSPQTRGASATPVFLHLAEPETARWLLSRAMRPDGFSSFSPLVSPRRRAACVSGRARAEPGLHRPVSIARPPLPQARSGMTVPSSARARSPGTGAHEAAGPFGAPALQQRFHDLLELRAARHPDDPRSNDPRPVHDDGGRYRLDFIHVRDVS